MATEEHKHLAEWIKNFHAALRAESREYGAEVAWKRHVARNDALQKYAISMRKLATKFWTNNKLCSENCKTYCRIEWIKAQCREYFFNGGKEKCDKREQNINAKITGQNEINVENTQIVNGRTRNCIKDEIQDVYQRRISLLDVGSCYNPFGAENMFDVTAIDLYPAANGVFQCDFLNVAIGDEKIFSQDNPQEICQLAANSFDAVVFSLLLEYLPNSTQRYICCRKAYNLLKIGGILIIVSPDSKRVGANVHFTRSWRYTLSKLGFLRYNGEKLRHIHCIAFRKSAYKNIATRWADLLRISENDKKYMSETEIFIPQDFQSRKEEQNYIMDKYNETDLANAFSELPFDDAIL